MILYQRESIYAYANSFEIGGANKYTVTVRRGRFFLSESIDEYSQNLLKLGGKKDREKEGKGKETRKNKHSY